MFIVGGGISVFYSRAALALTLSVALTAVPAMASRVHRAPTSGQSHRVHSGQTTHRPSKGKARKADSDQAQAQQTASGHTRQSKKARKVKVTRLRGQQAIAPERVTQIQQALIREHYLNGEATGDWDSATVAAMQKFQADQGWQTKLMPDSRALKKLGLGPDYSNAINAKNSSFAAPPPVSTIPTNQVAGFTESSGAHQ
jgi:hypothetical protein